MNNDLKTGTTNLRIAHLYAHFLNIYGDKGNIIALVKRANWRNIDVEVVAIDLNQKLDYNYFDIFFVGGGQDKQQQIIASDLKSHGHGLKEAIASGAVILSVCGGYQLLGHYYRPHQGADLEGISLIDAFTVAGNKRMIGNVVIERENGLQLVGFENHSGKTYLGKDVKALGKVITGNGNNGEDKLEGVCQAIGSGFVYGTYLHGSLLPKNPHLTDEIIRCALRRRFGEINLTKLDDKLETLAHDKALHFQA
jgi:CobQ-like glutamine amidotransferase family enzyme